MGHLGGVCLWYVEVVRFFVDYGYLVEGVSPQAVSICRGSSVSCPGQPKRVLLFLLFSTHTVIGQFCSPYSPAQTAKIFSTYIENKRFLCTKPC